MGACFEVYKEKGCGYLESVYRECLQIEFRLQNVPFASGTPLTLSYKGRPLQQSYIVDFICFEKIILEIKAVSNLIDEHRAQTLNYLATTDYKLGLLVNFGHFPKLEWERLVYEPQQQPPAPASFVL